MFDLIRDVSQETVGHLKKSKPKELNMKEFLRCYANDVIATTAFGLKVNSQENPKNEFLKMGKDSVNFSNFKFFFTASFNKFSTFFDIDVIPRKLNNYFKKIVLETMQHRKENNIFRPDLINILMDSNKVSKWTETEIVAQSFVFFLAAFETVSTALSFICQELMENPDIQEKVRKEIMEVYESLEGKTLTYDDLSKLKYCEAVISESLRKWPSAPFLERVCTKDTTLTDPVTGKDVQIKKGELISIYMSGIHRDPAYYPDPMKFDPERFSDENKHNITSNTYMPFGLGPRSCIGNRMALLEIKTLMFYLIKDFKLERHAKSHVPLVKLAQKAAFSIEPEGGFWLNVSEV